MRVLVDSSAWVDFFNGYDSPEHRAVAGLLVSDHAICTCGVVVAEVFQGLRKPAGREHLAKRFRDLDFLEASGFQSPAHILGIATGFHLETRRVQRLANP